MPDWFRAIRHIAVPFAGEGYSSYVNIKYLYKAMAQIPCLERISYILPDRRPTVSGTDTPGASVLTTLKARDGVELRVRSAEHEAVKVHCDYWDDPGGACPPGRIQYDTSLKEYLASREKSILNKFIYDWEPFEPGLVRIWNGDKKNPQLRIKIGACYVGRVQTGCHKL